MIKLSKKLAKSRVLNFLNPDFSQVVNNCPDDRASSFFERNRKVSHDTSRSGRALEVISMSNDVCDEEEDEEIVN